MILLRLGCVCGVVGLLAASVPAQQTPQPAPVAASRSPLGDTWGQLKVLPLHTHMHVAADHGGATCYLIAVDDASLTCGRSNGSAHGQHVFPRAEVKSVKLTRYAVSTVGGLGIGAGAGTAIGFAAFHHKSSTTTFDLSGLGDSLGRGICAVAGGLAGAAVGGPSDMFRGPTIYRRVPSR
ncbi:MAG TPA: hypothetical protein VHY48_09285 [Acidobacteriaceae bacterium]|nr:hypothetical protein [Acidobacteriaceae bacterium]